MSDTTTTNTAGSGGPQAEPAGAAGNPAAAGAALAFLVLADLLAYGTGYGLNLVLLCLTLAGGVAALRSRAISAQRPPLAGLAALLLVLPLLEAASWQALTVAVLGLAEFVLAVSGNLPARLEAVWSALGRFFLAAPFRLLSDTGWMLAGVARRRLGHALLRQILIWIVPLACAGVFLILFVAANPLLESALDAVDPFAFLDSLDPVRPFWWLLVAAMAWPFLVPVLLPERAAAVPVAPTEPPLPGESLLFGRAAILRSLLLFNGLFAVQSLSDLLFLWIGQALPEGMSYASYAHRGAYPLVATALLAAVFVLAAMRPGGPGEASPLIRRLVYLWIGQNVLLVISSMRRLDVYVEIYSLTELRIAAGIWMGLVALGLVLILLRIALKRSNAWLVSANLLALAATLAACACVDFGAIISRFNVEHSRQWGGEGMALDPNYLRELGPSSIPAVDLFLSDPGRGEADLRQALQDLRGELVARHQQSCGDWRCWTFRDWRLAQYLSSASPVQAP